MRGGKDVTNASRADPAQGRRRLIVELSVAHRARTKMVIEILDPCRLARQVKEFGR
jgi:hypothetical protein